MPIAVIALDFDPVLRLGDVTIRWQTVALAATIFVALCLAAGLARRTAMRPDDLLFVVVGIVPGAVIGGRIGAVLAHADFYQSSLGSIVDPGQGTLSLSLAVAGGTLSGAIVARLLGTPVRAWLHIAALPVLFGIAFGKLAMVLSAAGQGVPSELTWATAYLGPGPWSTLAPEIPSHPSQVYEAIGTVLVALLVLVASSLGLFRSADGRRLLVALVGWGAVRAAVSVTWRDPAVIGSLPAGGVIAIVVAIAAAAGAVALSVWWPRREQARAAAARPNWPDPETRPPF